MTDPDWGLVCKECRDEFETDLPMGVVQQHFISHHDTDKVELELIWKGQGPAPEAMPEWLRRG